MFDKILNLLVVTINQKIRDAKTARETEEKAREIATLQGNIIGWRKLINFLEVEFEDLPVQFVADNEEQAPRIESIDTQEIDELYAQMELLTASSEWENLLKKVANNKEFLKETLITTADSARDLYLAQAQQSGLTEYAKLFDALREEFQRRKEELNFDADAVPYEGPIEENKETPLALPGQLALPAPKKPRKGKNE
jgi:hypothetical protein